MGSLETEAVVIHVDQDAWSEEGGEQASLPPLPAIAYTEDGSIVVVIAGERWVVPDDLTNGLRQSVAAWEAQGNTISAHVPFPDDLFPNLEPDQFWFGLRIAGYEADVRTWVASLHDPESPTYNPVDWASASAKLEFAKYFERDHPLVLAAVGAIGITEAELDALWQFAAFG